MLQCNIPIDLFSAAVFLGNMAEETECAPGVIEKKGGIVMPAKNIIDGFLKSEKEICGDPKSEIRRFLQLLATAVDFAFQPIADFRTGKIYAYEALLRGQEKMGLKSIQELFDHAFDQGFLHCLDMTLRAMAMDKFSQMSGKKRTRLFFNLDNRILQSHDYEPGNTAEILPLYGLSPSIVTFEISEKHNITGDSWINRTLENYRDQGFSLAIDDFGTGYSGMQLLYICQPDFLKIDRFFISGIESDDRKRLFVSKLVELAKILGITVVAEGVETKEEFRSCREIGCDLAQGYYIGRPAMVPCSPAAMPEAEKPNVVQDSHVQLQ